MFPLLSRLPKNTPLFAALGALVALGLFTWRQHIELQRLRLAYENPRVEVKEKIVRVEGPVRVVTRTIRDPGGREEVLREEVRGPVTETTESASLKTPVFAPPEDRWLIGLGPSWRFNETIDWGVVAGRSFDNRLDLMAGVSRAGRVSALLVFRF